MAKQARILWKRLRRSLAANPGRLAGGSAVSDPLGLLAVEQERLAALKRSQHGTSCPAAGDERHDEAAQAASLSGARRR
jgi:hypothetical protein